MCTDILRPVTRALGLEPKMPVVPATPAAAPLPNVAQVSAAGAEAERARARAARGRASTILTGGQGDTTAPVLARPMASATRQLLG
ncbi:MAG: hypothetical protein K2X74_00415 [Acetobacteraceae bacterium]|nr:hypothetical protein [Acetobacteraceae bacterium]